MNLITSPRGSVTSARRQVSAQHDTSISLRLQEGRFLLNMIQAYHYVCKKAGFCSTWYKHIIMSARRQVSAQHDTSMSLILWEKVGFCSKWYKHIMTSARRQVSAQHDTSMSLSLHLQEGRFLFKMIQTYHDVCKKAGFCSTWYKHVIMSVEKWA